MPVTINPTNITFNDGSVQSSAASTGLNTVGSYCMLHFWGNGAAFPNAGSNYAAGATGATNQVWAGVIDRVPANPCAGVPFDFCRIQPGASISGTWRWMSASAGLPNNNIGLGVRVS